MKVKVAGRFPHKVRHRRDHYSYPPINKDLDRRDPETRLPLIPYFEALDTALDTHRPEGVSLTIYPHRGLKNSTYNPAYYVP